MTRYLNFYYYRQIVKIGLKFIRFLNENNIIYFLDKGTLLGCAKYSKVMLWDVDFDIVIFDKSFIHSKKFKKFIAKNKLFYFYPKIFTGIECCYKISVVKKGKQSGRKICDHPSFDIAIIYEKENEDGKKIIIQHKKEYKYSDFFPIRKKMFHGVEVNVPNRYLKILELNYPNYKDEINVFRRYRGLDKKGLMRYSDALNPGLFFKKGSKEYKFFNKFMKNYEINRKDDFLIGRQIPKI